jgi:hypothetical protein
MPKNSNMKNHRGYLLLFGLYTFLVPRFIFAALGQLTDSIDSERVAIHSNQIRTKRFAAYAVHQIENQAMQISEYAAPDGKIFAVSWKGRSNPDLQPLLGSYFGDFQTALHKRSAVRRVRMPFQIVKGSKVVVERWGQMHHLGGRGYVPELFPAGVTLNDIH